MSIKDNRINYIEFKAKDLEKMENEIVSGALVVLYHKNLDLIKNKIIKLNGSISKDIFSFPGGRRFHFIDPSGNELAVWFDK